MPIQLHSFAPRNDNVLVRLIPEPSQLMGGLVRPQTLKENVSSVLRGVVLATGQGHYPSRSPNAVRLATGVAEGDLVLLRGLAGQKQDQFDDRFDTTIERQNAGASVQNNGADYRIVRADEILAVLEEVTEEELGNIPTQVFDYTIG